MKIKIEAKDLAEFSINTEYLNIGQVPDSETFFTSENIEIRKKGSLTNVTDFNVWKRVLGLHEMMNWTKCISTSYGDVVNWNEMNWDTLSMYKKEANHSMICDGSKTVVRIKPKLSFPDSQIQSKAFRGKYLAMVDNQTQNEMLDVLKTKRIKCKNGK